MQHPEALYGKGGEQPALVAEVVRRGRMRDAGPAGELAQAELRRPGRLHFLGRGREQGGAQVAVVVAAGPGVHAPSLGYLS